MIKARVIVGAILLVCGLTVLVFVLRSHGYRDALTTMEEATLIVSATLIIAGALVVIGLLPNKIEYRDFTIVFFRDEVNFPRPSGPVVKPKRLSDREKDEKRRYVPVNRVPGGSVGDFNVLSDLGGMPNLDLMPHSNPMVPMYLLDKSFRIMDWNDALNLAFDRTMEGLRNKNALEWVYFMENFKAVLDHGISVFSKPGEHPRIDVEDLVYKSERYGPITARKRAYQIPDDQGAYAGWLVILDPHFESEHLAIEYQNDLIEILRRNLIWSEYAVYYDTVLNSTTVYPELLAVILGERGPRGDADKLPRIPGDARVLDLGAGTGNITIKLANSSGGRIVVAVENNRAMLARLKTRCASYLRGDDQGAGVLAIKQDISSLNGFNDNYFDLVILNNVLYSVDDPRPVLRGANRVLKPGGEIRISGPKKKTNLERLFRRIRSDLVQAGKFDELKEEYERVKFINEVMLSPLLYRWTVSDVQQMLVDNGFQPFWDTERAYEAQAMIVAARKS
jgi:ubiquinone/menaquinone biosynthesis C-methylase UbiE